MRQNRKYWLEVKYFSINFLKIAIITKMTKMKYFITVLFLAASTFVMAQKADKDGVKLVKDEAGRKVDVFVNGVGLTPYQYPSNIEKPILFPVYAPNGAVITRGYPIAPRKGERAVSYTHLTLPTNREE